VVLLAAAVLPRLLTLRGVAMTAQLGFADLPLHIVNLDRLHKLRSFDEARTTDPFFRLAPHQRELVNTDRWPAGAYHVARLWSGCFGPLSLWTTLLTNLLFTLVLVAGVIGLGVVMRDADTGRWGALLTLFCPPLVADTWYLNLDYPLTAMTTVGLLLLFHTRGFTDARRSLAFAVWSALSMFVKPSYALFIGLPALWGVARGLRGSWPASVRRVAPGLLLAMAAAIPLTVWLLDLNPTAFLAEIHHHFSPPPGSEEFPAAGIEPWTLAWVLALPLFAAMNHPLPLVLLSLPGLVLLHWPRWRLPPRGLLLAFLWGSSLVLTLLPNKLDRYMHPLYPLLCLLTVWWVQSVLSGKGRRAVALSLSLVAAAHVVVLCVAHLRPPPWHPGSRPSLPLRYTDLRLPGRDTLAGLRSLTYHPTCRLSPLLQELELLVRQDDSRRPLGVGYLPPERGESLPLDYERLGALATQVVRDRFVLPVDVGRDVLPPSTIVAHGPREDPRRFCPRADVVAERRVEVRCEDSPTELRLTLLRPRVMGERCRETGVGNATRHAR
jgi:hypothetical protein